MLFPLPPPPVLLGKGARVDAARKISEFFSPHSSLPPRSPAHIRTDVGSQTELTSEGVRKMETKVDREQLTTLQEVSPPLPLLYIHTYIHTHAYKYTHTHTLRSK